MKIGILSIYLHSNYGGILQVYALQTYLKNLGHDAIIIDGGRYSNPSLVKDFFKTIHWIMVEIKQRRFPHLHECSSFNHHNLTHFVSQHMKLMNKHDVKDIKAEEFDAIIVGSDQVWRKYPHVKDIAYYFLDFTSKWNIRRISYAASFGSDEWQYSVEETGRCGDMLKKFSGISVREYDAKALCKKYLKADAKVVIDPTMLLSENHYLKICNDESDNNGNIFLTYLLDVNPDKVKASIILEKILNKKAYEINRVNYLKQKPSIEKWLECFKNAQYILTDSFHGCVFSIIFNKPFIAYANSMRGISRFETLLKHFSLQDRMIYDSKHIEKIYNRKIDWKYVNSKLETLRQQAYDFLTKSLYDL